MPAASIPTGGYATRRSRVSREAIKELTRIPGVGPSIATDLYLLGIRAVSDLKGQDPQELYQRHMRQVGRHVDRCLLYVFRGAVYFASRTKYEPELLKWWNWKD